MKHYSRAALMAGAATIPCGLEVKDDTALAQETKKAVDELGRTMTEFRQKNDQAIEQLKKKGEDAVTKDELEKINKGIDDLKADINKQLDEVFKKANRMSLSGGDTDSARQSKAARAFGDLVGKADYSVEDLAEYKKDLANFIRRNEAKAATLSVGTDPAGGYMVTPDTSGRMVKKIYDSTPMRQLANVVSIGTDKLEGPIDNGEMDAQWVGEQTTRNGTDSPEFGMWTIDVHELYAYPTVTQRLLEDAKIDVEAWLGDKASSKFARKENTGFISGNGVLKPRGLMTYDMVATDDTTRAWGKFQYVLSGHATLINSADALINLIFELNPGYRQAAKFLLGRRTQRDVRKLKDGQNNYLSGLQLADGVLTEQLLGFGTVEGEDMPAIAAGSFPIAFGDFAETYTIVDRLGISVIRDVYTKPGFVKFLMRKRVGGGATNFESCKMLKVAAA